MKYIFSFLILSGLLLAGVACQKAVPVPDHPLREAYLLMDRGENSKAILLLEQVLMSQPDNAEARLLLASGYAGKAGLDVYALHRSFEDVLFKKPLSGRFWSDGVTGPEEVTALPAQDAEDEEEGLGKVVRPPTRAEQLVRVIDQFLGDVHRATIILERFPDIERRQWPLLDQALELLEDGRPENSGKDIALYRSFIRVVYIKAFLNLELMENARLGTREWACQIKLAALRDGLIWLTRALEAEGRDLSVAFPKKAITLSELAGSAAAFAEALEESRDSAAMTHTAAGFQISESQIRQVFDCESK